MVLIRYILSKKEYEGDRIVEDDAFIVNFAYMDMVNLMNSDLKFAQKNQNMFLEISLLIARFNLEFEQGHQFIGTFHEGKFPRAANPAIMSPRAYLGMKKNDQFQRIYRRATTEKVLTSPFSEARFIGVGYKDKGSRRKLEQDGSQTWQEIASQNIKHKQVKLVEYQQKKGLERLVKGCLEIPKADNHQELKNYLKQVIKENEKTAKAINPKTNIPAWKADSPFQKNLKIRKRLGTLPSWQQRISRAGNPSVTVVVVDDPEQFTN